MYWGGNRNYYWKCREYFGEDVSDFIWGIRSMAIDSIFIMLGVITGTLLGITIIAVIRAIC